MTEWRSLAMRDLMVEFHDGPHATPSPADAGPVYLGIKNITDAGLLELSDTRHIAEEDFAKWTRRVTPQPGDVVFTYEATLHRYAIIPTGFRGCLGRRLALIRPDEDVVLPRFLHFLMLGPAWRETVTSRIISGSTVDRIPIIDFPDFPISVPDLATQRAVVEMLGSIDDLIENNRRRIELLEQMAQAIYREWFVRFRYPGHEDAALVDSPLGPIPEGWDAVRIADLVSTQYGYTESAQGAAVGPRYLRGMDMNKTSYIDWSAVPYCPIAEKDRSKFRILPGDVFVIRMADPGKVGICEIDVDAVFASYLVRLRPIDDRIRPHYLFFTLRDDKYQDWVTGASTGATRKSVSAKVMTEPLIALPTQDVQQRFDAVVRPLRSLLNELLQGNSKLAGIRDLLLPKLVTGQIDVSKLDLDAAVESVA